MAETRSRGLSVVLTLAKLAILFAFIAGLTGTARVVAEAMRGERVELGELLLWPVLGLLPLAGGWATWKVVRGPDGAGLLTVAIVTILLGGAVITTWVVWGFAPR